jgi:sugar phosphate isomerase/epimerase
MPRIPVSAQLWSVREHVKNDFAGTVAALARFGFDGVELAGFGDLDAKGAAAAARAAGLRVSGLHVGIDSLRQSVDSAIADALTLGTTDLVVPWYSPALLASPSACIALGEELGALGRRVAAHGLRLHYHNHHTELVRFGDRYAFEYILDAAPAAHLFGQIDLYWVKFAGEDPASFLRRQGRRTRLVHLKDAHELGTGPVDYPSVFAALDDIGCCEWQIIEVEHYHHDPLESVRLSLEQLKRWGRA